MEGGLTFTAFHCVSSLKSKCLPWLKTKLKTVVIVA